MIFTHAGMAVRFDTTQVRQMGRVARGVRGVRLKDENDYAVAMESVRDTDTILVICENGFGKRSLVSDFRQTSRGGVGVRSIITSERNGGVVAAMRSTDNDGLLMIAKQGQVVRIPVEQIRVMGRSTQGVRLANFKKDSVQTARRLENIKSLDGSDEEQSASDELLTPTGADEESTAAALETSGDGSSEESSSAEIQPDEKQ